MLLYATIMERKKSGHTRVHDWVYRHNCDGRLGGDNKSEVADNCSGDNCYRQQS